MSQTIQVASGWRDFGLKIRGPPALELAAASDEMFAGLISGTTVFPPAQSGLAEDLHIRRGRDSSRRPGPEQYDQTGLEPRPQTRTAGCDYLRLLFAAQPHPAPNGAAGPARAQSPIDPAGQVRRVPLTSGCAKLLSPPFAGRRRDGSDQSAAGALGFGASGPLHRQ